MGPSTEIVHIPRGGDVVRAEDFLPLMTVEQAVNRKEMMNEFINKVMKEGEDYGPMPGDKRQDKRKVLLKPGAEKLCSIFGLAPRYVKETVIEDWTGDVHGGEPLFYYEYRCQLYRGDKFMGEGIGSCNSWEAKYRYRWITTQQMKAMDLTDEQVDRLMKRGGVTTLFEPYFAIDKRELTGKYGKPIEHWNRFDEALRNGTERKATRMTQAGKEMTGLEIDVDETWYRVPNPDVADLVNTCQKIGQKRAQVAAVLVVTNCSDAFTQDLEDMGEPEPVTRANHQQNGKEEQAELGKKRVAEEQAKTEAETPAKLREYYARIDKDVAATRPVFAELWETLQALGGEGVKAYGVIQDAFNKKYPKGTTNKEALKTCIRELFHAIRIVEVNIAQPKEPVPTEQSNQPEIPFEDEPDGVTMEQRK